MKSPSLSTRLWLPALIATGVIAVMAFAIAARTQDQIQAGQVVQKAHLDSIEQAARWAGLTDANAARAIAALSTADASLRAALKPDMEATTEKISQIQKSIESSATSEAEKVSLAKVAETRKAYVGLRKEVLAGIADSAASPEQVQAVRNHLAAYLEAQRAFVALQHRLADQHAQAIAAQRMNTVYGVILIMLVLSGFLLSATGLAIRSIVPALRRVLQSIERIAAGDLTVRVDTDRQDEIGDLMHGLDTMTTSLRHLVGEVRSGATGMQIASAEIATGNADLSNRTEQTAGSLQETAGSMSQLTSTVQQSAEAAAQANQLASSAADAAQRGGQVVSQVVSNMDEIANSSRKIGDIIGVIDGIAFQTNILALNAAVEAARAGEQGRGFAVVAGEVRALAQRSAGAAREIKSLIGASMTTVEHGSKLVQDAGSTMTELVASVRRVSDIIGEITASATEQNDGIRQVNQAVTRLDEMTQQNAALVEESAAAADSLREQAQRLNGLVQKFEIGQEPGSGPGSSSMGSSRPSFSSAPPSAARARPAPPSVTPLPARPLATVSSPAVGTAAAAMAAAPAPAPAPCKEAATTAPSDDWETF